MISARTLTLEASLWRCSAALTAALSLLGNACTPDFSTLTKGFGASSGAGSAGTECAADECAGEAGQGGGAPGAAGHGGKGGAGKGGGGGGHAGGATDSGGSGGTGGDVGGTGGDVGGTGETAGGPALNIVDLPGVASADSEEAYKGNTADKGHDGDFLTRWVAADGAPGHYWTLDLGAAHRLSRLEVTWEYPYGLSPPASYLYTVSVSDDSSVYNVVIDKTDNQEVTPLQIVDFPPDTIGRYVRLTVTTLPPLAGPGKDYWASFFELRFFGNADPE